jgi:hypothetical protein
MDRNSMVYLFVTMETVISQKQVANPLSSTAASQSSSKRYDRRRAAHRVFIPLFVIAVGVAVNSGLWLLGYVGEYTLLPATVIIAGLVYGVLRMRERIAAGRR